MKKDILEKGAILQRDKKTYAIAPHMPCGITTPEYLRKIADASEKYNAQALKLTSAQRIAIVGLPEEKLDDIWADLGEKPGHAIGLCVRSIKSCPGVSFCKRGMQDSLTLGLDLDEKYHGMDLPWKIKLGVSGCPIDCGEVCIKDVGLIGSPKGWNVMVGGNGGAQPRLSQKLAENVTREEALEIVDRILNWIKDQKNKGRLGKLIETVGLEEFKAQILEPTA
jgi:NAD(P)H-nitrite reductase large subunit